MKKKSIIGSSLALLAGIPLLANAIGWGLTAIAMALFIVLAVTIWSKVKNG